MDSVIVKFDLKKIVWWRVIMHVLIMASPFVSLFFLEVQLVHWIIAGVMYCIMMFLITGGYHRYFAHKTYKMGRGLQFLMAVLACLSCQNSPLWWAAHHRHHHQFSDQDEDIHSPVKGIIWSHYLWIFHKGNQATRVELIPDLLRFPELRLIHKFWLVPPVLFGVMMFVLGGLPMLMIGFLLPMVCTLQATYTINSLMHVFGKRVYATDDTSKNSPLLALLTFGEGWHNNHHYFAASVRQGFRWYEYDFTYWFLKAMKRLGLVWGMQLPSKRLIEGNLISQGNPDPAIERVEALREKYLPRKQTIWGWSFYLAALLAAIALGVLLIVFGALKGAGAAYIVGVSIFLLSLIMFYSVKIVEWTKLGSQRAMKVVNAVDARFFQFLVAAAFSPVVMHLDLGVWRWIALGAMWALTIAIMSVKRGTLAWNVMQSIFVIGMASAVFPMLQIIPRAGFQWLAATLLIFMFAYKIRPYFQTMRLSGAYFVLLIFGTMAHFVFLNEYVALAAI